MSPTSLLFGSLEQVVFVPVTADKPDKSATRDRTRYLRQLCNICGSKRQNATLVYRETNDNACLFADWGRVVR